MSNIFIRLDDNASVTVDSGFSTGEITLDFKIKPEDLIEQILNTVSVEDIISTILELRGVNIILQTLEDKEITI